MSRGYVSTRLHLARYSYSPRQEKVFSSLNDDRSGRCSDDVPTSTSYWPESALHVSSSSCQNDTPYLPNDSSTRALAPGARSSVLPNARSCSFGWVMGPRGGATYSCTTSLPLTEPVFFTSTLALTWISVSCELGSDTLRSDTSNDVYDSPKLLVDSVPVILLKFSHSPEWE